MEEAVPVIVSSKAQPTTLGNVLTSEPRGRGEQIDPRTERAIESFFAGMARPYAQANDTPSHWDPAHPQTSTRVGWVLKAGGRALTGANFAFRINPQSIMRQMGSRTQLQPTKRAFYLDDFGPGAETIQIQQLVGAGGLGPTGGFTTLREEVLQFYEQIYLRALGPGYKNPIEVWFYDSHLYDGAVPQGHAKKQRPEQVYFPPNSFQFQRSVSLNNVWQFTIQMVSLERPNTTPPGAGRSPKGTVLIISDANEDLHHFARRMLAARGNKRPSNKQVQGMEREIRRLNRDIGRNRRIPIFSPGYGEVPIRNNVYVKRNHIVTGEKILLPS